MPYTNPNTGLIYSTPEERSATGYTPTSGDLLVTSKLPTTNTTLKLSNEPIDSSRIGENPINLAGLKQGENTTNNALSAVNDSTAGQIKTDATLEPTQTQNEDKAGLRKYLTGILGNIQGQAEQENKIREDAQLQQKKQKALAISNELDLLDKGFKDQVKEIRLNREGKFGGAVEQDVRNAQIQYEDRRANIALTYKVAAQDYQGAEEIVNQKVASLEKQNQQALQAYSMFKDLIYDDLTESEKLQADSQMRMKEDRAKAITDAYATVLQNAADQKAPASVLTAIDEAARKPDATVASIYQAAGRYGGDIAKQAQVAKIYADMASGTSTVDPNAVVDANSTSILSQTGLSLIAFNYLAQGTPALTRMSAAQRQKVMNEAQSFLNNKGLDVSTFQSRYKAYNDVLQKNIERSNQTTIYAGEVAGTVDQFVDEVGDDFSKIRPSNIVKLFAGKQVNDPIAQKYAFNLETMRNDLAGYYAASRGATGNNITDADKRDAEKVIISGLSSGSAEAFKQSLLANEKKVTDVVNRAVDSANKQIWGLFGVGDKYKSTVKQAVSTSTPNGGTLTSGITWKLIP